MKIKKNLFWHQHSHEFHRHVKGSAFCYRQVEIRNEMNEQSQVVLTLASVIPLLKTRLKMCFLKYKTAILNLR